MEILLISVLFGVIGIAIGTKKGLHPVVAFVGGALLGPLWFLILFAKSKKKTCPNCAQFVDHQALICKYCGSKLTEPPPRDAHKLMTVEEARKEAEVARLLSATGRK